MNIRSHFLHLDKLHVFLSSLNINFQVIGLSEIECSTDAQAKTNVDLPGYKFHCTPSQSADDGVGVYVKSELKADQKDDLCVSDIDSETVWIEINDPKAKNTVLLHLQASRFIN